MYVRMYVYDEGIYDISIYILKGWLRTFRPDCHPHHLKLI